MPSPLRVELLLRIVSDAGGLLDEGGGGDAPRMLGLKLPEVAGRLCEALHLGKSAGAAFLRLDASPQALVWCTDAQNCHKRK